MTMEALAGDMSYLFDTNTFRAMAPTATAPPMPMPLPMTMPATTATATSVATANTTAATVGEWDDAAFDSLNFELDLGFDTFLLATADDFMEPFAQTAQQAAAKPTSPPMFADHSDCSSSCPSESEASVADEEALLPMATAVSAPAKRSRKRKNPDAVQYQQSMVKAGDKKVKNAQIKNKMVHAPISAEAERLYRRRYDILHEILEAWNTGGIEDMEEIADDVYDSDVTLVSPDYSEGLKGVQALMHHWTLLLDSFPDGIMEEYNIERDDPEGQKMNVTWVFSGTQIFPFFGVEPRHEKVTIRGSSFFTFKGEKISQMVLSWNYREALMQLMGVSPAKAERR